MPERYRRQVMGRVGRKWALSPATEWAIFPAPGRINVGRHSVPPVMSSFGNSTCRNSMIKPAKNTAKPRDTVTKQPEAPSQTHATRETIESIVIAFVLAFLFRTFEAEAFVIPTGSMAPTLMGRHKDVNCLKCGHRFRVTASEEGEEAEQLRAEIRGINGDISIVENSPQKFRDLSDQQRKIIELQQEAQFRRQQISGLDIVSGVCPMCRFAMPMDRNAISSDILESVSEAEPQPSFNGDRILVNKYLYTLTEPKRWDVVVFHFPGNAEQNYIKRLVGLPGETLRVFQGDLLVATEGAANEDFKIARKPPETVLAMRQLVHDTDYDPAELQQAGWPLRWQATTPTGADGWQVATEANGTNVAQRYTIDRTRGGEAWLRYFHKVPNAPAWQIVSEWKRSGNTSAPATFPEDVSRTQLIMDFNAYNTRVRRSEAQEHKSLWPKDEFRLGAHWVGDLMLEADVEVLEAKGELLLNLVEAGKHFTVRIDLTTGQATLGIEGLDAFAPTAKTSLTGAGRYRLALANVDDQLLLWIDGDLIEFDAETTYDAAQVFDAREIRPHTTGPSGPDKLDLSPAGVGANGAKLAVTRLQLWRDIYYIADSWKRRQEGGGNGPISDYVRPTTEMVTALRYDPARWEEFSRRQHVDFPLSDDQFFVMGDNSPESSDARLWMDGPSRGGGRPGGAYLQRDLLIGKAVCVYWPHASYSLPYLGIPIWPNFKDMRLVR